MIATLTTCQNPQRNPASSSVRLLTCGDIPRCAELGRAIAYFEIALTLGLKPQACTNLHIICRSHHRMLAAAVIFYKVEKGLSSKSYSTLSPPHRNKQTMTGQMDDQMDERMDDETDG